MSLRHAAGIWDPAYGVELRVGLDAGKTAQEDAIARLPPNFAVQRGRLIVRMTGWPRDLRSFITEAVEHAERLQGPRGGRMPG